jgi:hypothetical protein
MTTVSFLRGMGLTSHQQSVGHMETFQLYWWRVAPSALLFIISSINRHPSRNNDVS